MKDLPRSFIREYKDTESVTKRDLNWYAVTAKEIMSVIPAQFVQFFAIK